MKATVYLAGKMTGLCYVDMKEWRLKARGKLLDAGFRVVDPTDTDFGESVSSKEIVRSNKYLIDHSDLVLAEFTHKEVSIGTIGEVVYAAMKGKPIIAWGKPQWLEHPWLDEHITCSLWELSEAIEYIVKNYKL